MMVISIANQKGGVGKTTTALCLADGLTRRGRRVLVVDLDQQANASRVFGAATEGAATAYDVLTGHVRDAARAVQRTDKGDILSGDGFLSQAEGELAQATMREKVLKKALRGLIKADVYDYVLIDCPPSLGLVTINALVASDGVVVPMKMDGYSVDGLDGLMSLVSLIKGDEGDDPDDCLNPRLSVLGLVVCQVDRRRKTLLREFGRHLPILAESYGTRVFQTWVAESSKVPAAQLERDEMLHAYAPLSSAAIGYECVVDELLGLTEGV